MNCFDANTWTGPWPFTLQPALTPKKLVAQLAQHGVARALVSPLAAVFAPEPGPANRALLRDTRGLRACVPVPVINPALPNWREQIADVAEDPRVRAVRFLPAYHAYRLDSRAADSAVEELERRGLKLVVSVRLIDERHEHPVLHVKPVRTRELTALLERHRNLPLLVSGLVRPDVTALLPRFPQLLADLSFVEWHDTLDYLVARVDARQLAFASHTPFLITEAAIAKLASARAAKSVKQAIAAGNLTAFLERKD